MASVFLGDQGGSGRPWMLSTDSRAIGRSAKGRPQPGDQGGGEERGRGRRMKEGEGRGRVEKPSGDKRRVGAGQGSGGRG